MKKQILLIVSAFIIGPAFAQPTDATLTSEFDNLLNKKFKSTEPGVTVLVARKGNIIYHKGFGMANLELNVPMQTNHVFRIGSITKQFTAIAILQLVEQSKLSLQDEITKFIPDYPTQGQKITIENLLTHTSGIQSYTNMKDFRERMTLDVSPTEMIDHFKNEPMEFPSGTSYNYCNSGYFLLGYIIEKASGKTYAEYIEENFFKKLGMKNSLYGSDTKLINNRAGMYSKDDSAFVNAQAISMTQPYAAGSIQSTVEDLYTWHKAVHAYKLVKKEWVDKAHTSYVLPNGQKTNYGYGWQFGYVQESPTIEHGGGINGSLTMSIYLPNEDVFVAVFSSCECFSPEDLTAQLAAMTIGKSYSLTAITAEAKTLKEYAAVYENEKGEQRIISLTENQLQSQRGRNQKFDIMPYAKDKFFFPEAMVTIEFQRNKKGKIEKLTTHGRDGNVVWVKTNKPVPGPPKEITVDEKILESYVGEYAITPDFTFVVSREKNQMFLQATGQMKVEMFAKAENKFFLKVNDAELEFISENGIITKAILVQGGRNTDAKKIK